MLTDKMGEFWEARKPYESFRTFRRRIFKPLISLRLD